MPFLLDLEAISCAVCGKKLHLAAVQEGRAFCDEHDPTTCFTCKKRGASLAVTVTNKHGQEFTRWYHNNTMCFKCSTPGCGKMGERTTKEGEIKCLACSEMRCAYANCDVNGGVISHKYA